MLLKLTCTYIFPKKNKKNMSINFDTERTIINFNNVLVIYKFLIITNNRTGFFFV